MGTATFTITDLDGALSEVSMSSLETGAENPNSPTPSELDEQIKRAIVDHPIPGLDRDIGQDMGAHSREYQVTGLVIQGDRDKIKNMALAAQFTASNPGGRFKIEMKTAAGSTVWSHSGVAIRSASFRYLGGVKKYFRAVVTFKEYAGQQ